MRRAPVPEDIERTIMEFPDDLARMLRALANRKRLQILVILIGGHREFGDLNEATELSKTALANHLSQLVRSGLVERLDRGDYGLTDDGLGFLEFLAGAYGVSRTREESARKRLVERYSRGYDAGGRVRMESFEVKDKAEYQPGWISYVAAVSGVMKSLGVKCDEVDLAGYSGYAFIVNVSKGMTCPSGPTAHGVWNEIHNGSMVLGWQLVSVSEEVSYPQGEVVTAEDLERARRHFEQVKEGLLRTKRPVVIWGIPVPEYGIVNGYSGDSYEVSTFRHLMNEPDSPIRFDGLQAPGCLEVISFERVIPQLDVSERDLEAVKRAVRMSEGEYAPKGYFAGPEAYEEWSRVLEDQPDKVMYHGNSYVGACTCEGKAFAAEFLKRMAGRCKGEPQGQILSQASKEYERAQKLMEEFTGLFPFAIEAELPKKKLAEGASILKEVAPHEIAGRDLLRKAAEVWE